MIIAISCLGLIAEELRLLPWSEKLNYRERFYPVSSGNMKISWDAAEKAVRFDIPVSYTHLTLPTKA